MSTVAFGPALSGWGSWEWVGADLEGLLKRYLDTKIFHRAIPNDCDAVVVVKHPWGRIKGVGSLSS